ncbi:hypothetical protein GJ496_010045 [Pomphorhynchus laevis]|nr:hypothetical protein GJ496_010045 [Pomphorhynchus laevis]
MYDKASKKCVPFQLNPLPVDVNNSRMYADAEMIVICEQLWMDYDVNLKFCVKRKFNWKLYPSKKMQLPKPKLIQITGQNPSNILVIHKRNFVECFFHGLNYNSSLGACEYLTQGMLQQSLAHKLCGIDIDFEVHRSVWSMLCNKFDMKYNTRFKLCLSKTTDLGYKFKPTVKQVFAGKVDDIFNKHLECLLLGFDFLRDQDGDFCISFELTKGRDTLRNHKVIVRHSKEILCAKLLMVYQERPDICAQNPSIKKVRVRKNTQIKLSATCDPVEIPIGDAWKETRSFNDSMCFKHGLRYNYGTDNCEVFPEIKDSTWEGRLIEALRIRYMPFVHQMLRANCYLHGFDYMRKLRVCNVLSIKRGKTTHKTEFDLEELKRKDEITYQTNRFLKCVAVGLDYDRIKDDCVPYPDPIHTSNLVFYEKNWKMQIRIACKALGWMYIPSHDYCVQKQFVKKALSVNKSQLLDETYKIETSTIVKKYCFEYGLAMHSQIDICKRKSEDKFKFKKRYTYDELMIIYCAQLSKHFDPLQDACTSVFTYKALRTYQLNGMCKKYNLEYDEDIQWCVMKRKSFERATPPVPVLHPDHTEESALKTCFLSGMLYSPSLRQCTRFLRVMTEFEVKYAKRKLQKYIDFYFKKYCEAINMDYHKFYGFCLARSDEIFVINRSVSDFTIKRSIINKHFCFLKGMQLFYRKEPQKCEPFPREGPELVKLRDSYEVNREMFLARRCPVYLEYHKQFGFCVRRTPKLINVVSYIRIFSYRGIYFFSRNKSEIISDVRMTEEKLAKCCYSKGLDFSKVHRSCITILVRPTPYEIEFYRNHELVVKSENFQDYCHYLRLKMEKREGFEVCV